MGETWSLHFPPSHRVGSTEGNKILGGIRRFQYTHVALSVRILHGISEKPTTSLVLCRWTKYVYYIFRQSLLKTLKAAVYVFNSTNTSNILQCFLHVMYKSFYFDQRDILSGGELGQYRKTHLKFKSVHSGIRLCDPECKWPYVMFPMCMYR